jgi:hypothetical protein
VVTQSCERVGEQDVELDGELVGRTLRAAILCRERLELRPMIVLGTQPVTRRAGDESEQLVDFFSDRSRRA